jgi:hypothetical protein
VSSKNPGNGGDDPLAEFHNVPVRVFSGMTAATVEAKYL